MRGVTWAVAVTTVPARQETLLPKTLESLKAAGWDKPRLFADTCNFRQASWYMNQCGLEVTPHWPAVGAYLNWVLGLAELMGRFPMATYYLMAQDDILLCRNTRQFLERQAYPERGWLNLITYPEIQPPPQLGWFPSPVLSEGTHPLGWQVCRGAQALVFSREAAKTLLQCPQMIEKPSHAVNATRNIDGIIQESLNRVGWKQWLHHPSLVQHVGEKSIIGNPIRPALSFPGGDYDALSLLKEAA